VTKHFVSEPVEPVGAAAATGEPDLPAAFRWHDREIRVAELIATRRTAKVDRGDTYVKRHYFDFRSTEGALVTVYFDRQAKRGAARWWLYALEEE